MKYIFKILRFDPLHDEHPHFQEFSYSPSPKDSVLEALKSIRDQQDPSLSFRYSCREAVCGSCAMVINGEISLACRTMVESLKSPCIVVEPLPNLEIQKDLFVPSYHIITRSHFKTSKGIGFEMASTNIRYLLMLEIKGKVKSFKFKARKS